MAVKKMGFEGKVYYGTAGSTASTEITNSRDMTITLDMEEGETTVRGAGSSPPVNTSRVTALTWGFEWTMTNKSDDTTLEALKVAAAAGTPVALRTKDYSSGKGYDGDVILSMRHSKPYKAEQEVTFTAKPNDDNRDPSLYV